MASEILIKYGTTVTWKTTGGTKVITLTSMANNVGRVGEPNDFGATRAYRYRWRLKTKFGTGPAQGAVIRLAVAASDDNTTRDGNLGSSDAVASDVDVFAQCQFIGFFICDNVTTAQESSGEFVCAARYMSPVILNVAGQTLSGTAGDHEFSITPVVDEAQ